MIMGSLSLDPVDIVLISLVRATKIISLSHNNHYPIVIDAFVALSMLSSCFRMVLDVAFKIIGLSHAVQLAFFFFFGPVLIFCFHNSYTYSMPLLESIFTYVCCYIYYAPVIVN